MTQLDNVVRLFGLKMPYGDEFCSYFESLPEHWELCEDFRDFYRLKKGKRAFKKENYELNEDLEYLIYSPSSNMYYYRKIREYTNVKRLYQYFKDGNLYIYKKDIRDKVDYEIKEETETVNHDNDSIIF